MTLRRRTKDEPIIRLAQRSCVFRPPRANSDWVYTLFTGKVGVMDAYSQDLRDRLIAAVEGQTFASHTELALTLGVSRSFLQKLLRRKRTTGQSAALLHGGGRQRTLAPEAHRIRTEVTRQPDVTLAELCERVEQAGGRASHPSMMCRELQTLHLPRKKKVVHASQRDAPRVQQLRKSYWEIMAECVVPHLKFIDESGLHLSFTRLYGRAASSERVVDAVPYQPDDKWTLIAALGWRDITAPWVLPGSMNGLTFETYVEYVLAPTLKRDDIVVMDNLPAHKAGVIAKLIQARGARLQLLPPYSPDCNPIELCWAKIKTALRAAKARTFDALLDALKAALLSITPSDALAWLNHCGYCVHP